MTRSVQIQQVMIDVWLLVTGQGHRPVSQGAALLVSMVVLLVCFSYCVYSWSRQSEQDSVGDDSLNAEFVRQKTQRSSGEPDNHPSFPPGKGPNSATNQQADETLQSAKQPASSGQSSMRSGESKTSQSQQLNTSELSFSWRIKSEVTFEDIGGLDEVKRELRVDILKPFQNPEQAEKLGVSVPNLLLYGPPGTGKTYLAKALASELRFPFVQLSGADVQSKWINESAAQVNTLFREAKTIAEKHGGAVVFMDELDSVLKQRDGAGSAHAEDEKVVNEFLSHLEGSANEDIVFIGATNRLEALDSAGVRSGRIDKKIHIKPPDEAARKAILRAQLSDRQHEISETQLNQIAHATDGLVAADLDRLIRKAAKRVLARDGDTVLWKDLQHATHRRNWGENGYRQ